MSQRQVYKDLVPTFPDPETWTFDQVLRHHASQRPDAVCLDAPVEEKTWTYAEALSSAERIAGTWLSVGAEAGDRVIIMALNSSQFVRSWWGTAVGNLVQVPINTNYEGEFLRHQLSVVDARYAVIDDVFASRFVAIEQHARGIKKFWVVDTDQGVRDQAIELLRANGWDAAPWEELEEGPVMPIEPPKPQELGAIFFTSGTTGPSKGVSMPHSQLYFFAQEVVSLSRLTHEDVYLTTTPLFHGNAQFMAVYPVIIAGGRAVIRPKFSASGWIDHVRDSGVTATNFVGVMMDFVWKQPARENDRENNLRVVYAAPTAASYVEEFKERYGVEAVVDAFGLTETCAPILAPYGVPRPAGAAGLAAADWFDIRLVDPETDREVPVGEVGELVVRPKQPWTCSNGYYACLKKLSKLGGTFGSTPVMPFARTKRVGSTSLTVTKTRCGAAAKISARLKSKPPLWGTPAVEEVAVVGVPADFEAGEDEVLAAVVLSEDVDPAEVLKWCEGKIPAFAIPRYLRVVEELPKTPSQKIRKAVLREQSIDEHTFDSQAVRA